MSAPIKLASFTLYLLDDGNLLSDIETIPVAQYKAAVGDNLSVNALEFVNMEFDAVRANLEKHLRNI